MNINDHVYEQVLREVQVQTYDRAREQVPDELRIYIYQMTGRVVYHVVIECMLDQLYD
jgi:hypothetical protein